MFVALFNPLITGFFLGIVKFNCFFDSTFNFFSFFSTFGFLSGLKIFIEIFFSISFPVRIGFFNGIIVAISARI